MKLLRTCSPSPNRFEATLPRTKPLPQRQATPQEQLKASLLDTLQNLRMYISLSAVSELTSIRVAVAKSAAKRKQGVEAAGAQLDNHEEAAGKQSKAGKKQPAKKPASEEPETTSIQETAGKVAKKAKKEPTGKTAKPAASKGDLLWDHSQTLQVKNVHA